MVVNSEKGMALVLTLMILVLITAMVVEFSYGVYTTTSALHNWEEAQRLSFVAKSGLTITVKAISDYEILGKKYLYRYLGKQIPLENMTEGFNGRLILMAEDENSKFNLNSLKTPGSVDVFKRLLTTLNLNEEIADRVAQWIGAGSNTRLRDSEESAKKDYMDSIDELLLIKGVDRQSYEKLLPYVTVYDYAGSNDMRVNMNTASIPVIMSLANISKESAERLVNQREREPFNTPGESTNIGVDLPISLFTADTPKNFRITAIAEENKIKRVIECVVRIESSSQATVKYWKEL